MLGRAWGCSLAGVEAFPVRVECAITRGLPGMEVVGLAGAAVKEATARVRTAVRNSGLDFPLQKITFNLAPGEVRKAGSGLDLPMATALLQASGQWGRRDTQGWLLVGELGLDGEIRPVAGILAMALLAREMNMKMVVAPGGGGEAGAVEGLEVRVASSLSALVAWSQGNADLPLPAPVPPPAERPAGPDFQEVRGQELAKRALCAAAAGGHHLILVGPPGAGKSMLANCLAGILPPLSLAESLEVTRIWSVAGMIGPGQGLLRTPPWRAPHPHLGRAGLVGGGQHPVKPGEVSLSHRGVLFLDEMNRFAASTLECLRSPLEEGRVTLGRLGAGVTFPARFMLVGAMNPCHCGRLGDPEHPCTCSGREVGRYWERLSGPLLDRIDIQVEVPRLPWEEWKKAPAGYPTARLRETVRLARERQAHRLHPVGKCLNAEMSSREVHRFCTVSAEGERLLAEYFRHLGMSSRGYYRVLKVARTLADLDEGGAIRVEHLSQALEFRCLHRFLSAAASRRGNGEAVSNRRVDPLNDIGTEARG